MGGSSTSKTVKGKAGKKKESRKQKALRFQRMGSEMGLRDKRLKIERLMKAKQKLVPKVVQFLESITEWPESDSSSGSEECSSDAGDEQRESVVKAKPVSKKSVMPDAPEALLHKNYTSLD
eukprot:3243024-Amphidinium_carterae.1